MLSRLLGLRLANPRTEVPPVELMIDPPYDEGGAWLQLEACRRPASLVLEEKRCLAFVLDTEDCMDGLDEWKALPGERGNLADKEPEGPILFGGPLKPADEGTGEGKEKVAMVPNVGSDEPAFAEEELSPQTGSLLGGRTVEMVSADGAPTSGVEAAWLARLPM